MRERVTYIDLNNEMEKQEEGTGEADEMLGVNYLFRSDGRQRKSGVGLTRNAG